MIEVGRSFSAPMVDQIRVCRLLLAVVISVSFVSSVFSQQVGRALSVADIEDLLRAGVTARRLTTLVEERGVDFEVTERVREKFKTAGADASVMQAVEKATLEFTKTKNLAPAAAGNDARGVQGVTKERREVVSGALYEKAKQEGALVVYSVWDVEHVVAVLGAFSKRYPGIKTNYWCGRNPEIVTRVYTEFQAGRASVDVILSDNAPPVLRAAGAIMAYETVQKDSLLMHDPTMPIVSLQIQALAYNTRKIKPEELPKTWEDVANPKYRGMVALDDPMRAGPLSAQLVALKGFWKDDARFSHFVKGLKALNVPVHRSTSAMVRLVITGEYALAMPALLHDVLSEKEKGTPIDLVRTAPPVLFPRYAAIYTKAPHQSAAKLFAEWLITPEGQAALDSVGREASRKNFRSKTSIEASYPSGTNPLPVHDKLCLEDPKKWLDANVKSLWGG